MKIQSSGALSPSPSIHSKPLLWGLADCNSFYCSCERLFRPDLAGKPVVVLSNNDGCLIALTPEAKALGFKLGDIYFQVRHRLESLKVTTFSSNYTLYGDISNRVMHTMETMVPIDQYSIDESFIPFYEATAVQAIQVGWELRNRVGQWVGMPIRVGIGPTRTIAKLANLWAKKKEAVCKLDLHSVELEKILEDTPTIDIWGIGRKQAEKLAKIGVHHAKALRDMDPEKALKLLTVTGQRTVLELRGMQCIMDNEKPVPRKTLVNSRSFGRRVTNKEALIEAMTMHCTIAGERLRSEKVIAGGICIQMQTSMHSNEPYFSTSASASIAIPTNCTSLLIKYAMEALDKCYKAGYGYMKGGILLYDLEVEDKRQLTLLESVENPESKKQKRLMRALDKANDKYGRFAVHYSSQGPKKADWHMQRSKLSGAVTTKWADLINVKTG